jgi:hypothetical protein
MKRWLLGLLSMTLVASTAGAATLWSAGHEADNTSEWSRNGGGGLFNSGKYRVDTSADRAHTGDYSLKAEIYTSSSLESGVRAFRWAESRKNRDLYYSAWFYIPTRPAINGWNSIFQWKSRTSSRNDPFWYIEIIRRSNGTLGPKLTWWNGLGDVEGPHRGEHGGRTYSSTAVIPVGQWFHLEGRLVQSPAFDGRVTFWLNGQQIFDQVNVKTGHRSCTYNSWCVTNEWSLNNYGRDISPSPYAIYIDDAVINTARVGSTPTHAPQAPTGLRVAP